MQVTLKIFAILFILLYLSVTSFAQSYYGEELSAEEKEQAILVNQLEDKSIGNEKDIVLKGTILKTCAMKGCWMTIDLENGQEMMVKFKDYGFFVPTEGVGGKEATFKGIAKKEVISVDELRHYAEDAGKSEEEISAITESQETYTFVASGVIIE